MTPTPDEATTFIEHAEFVWHQRFELAPGVFTPGRQPDPLAVQRPSFRLI